MDWSEAISQLLGYPVPPVYGQMWQAGLLDRSREEYLLLSQADWLGPSQILSHRFRHYWQEDYVAFAVLVNGDAWCWSRQTTSHAGVIMCCPRDMAAAIGYAPDFIGGVYRLLLEEFACSWHMGFAVSSTAELASRFQQYAVRARPFLPAAWRTTLEELSTRQVREVRGGFGVLDQSELASLVEKDLAFSGLNRYFPARTTI